MLRIAGPHAPRALPAARHRHIAGLANSMLKKGTGSRSVAENGRDLLSPERAVPFFNTLLRVPLLACPAVLYFGCLAARACRNYCAMPKKRRSLRKNSATPGPFTARLFRYEAHHLWRVPKADEDFLSLWERTGVRADQFFTWEPEVWHALAQREHEFLEKHGHVGVPPRPCHPATTSLT